MKKLVIIALVVLLCVGATLSFVACNKTEDDANTLNVVVLNKGYGKDWIEELKRIFEEQNPGYTVKLEAVATASDLISSHLASRDNVDDLYISVGNDWMTYAAQGKFASLDDLLEEEVDGVKIKDKVKSEYQNSIYYPAKDGSLHTYRLPWIAATGGIFYNQKFFENHPELLIEDNGERRLPETYAELVTLCNNIVNAEIYVDENSEDIEYVKPFAYTSANTDYFDYTVYTWWAQLAGEEAINEFLKYGSADNYSTTNPTYQKLKQATQMWYDLFGNSKNVVSRTDNHAAQQAFCNGEAAMMFNGDWMYNEISKYDLSADNFELALMKTPTAEGAVDDILYTIGEDQYIAIPETSSKKDLAKKFIKLMVSDQGCKVFLTKANGMLAYDCDFTADQTFYNGLNGFLKNLITVRDSYQKTFTNFVTITPGETNVNQTSKMLYLTSQIDIWGTSALRPYTSLLNGDATIDASFTTISTEMSRTWESLLRKAGIK